MDFEYDVFISYAHLDNKYLSGWITQFHEFLMDRLGELLGREPKIWFDLKLYGNDEFSSEIESKLCNAKILVSVISPRYIKSKWCMKELRHFKKAAKKNIGTRIGNKSRIFKVIKTLVPKEQIPDEITGSIGYKFFKMDLRKKPQEFRPEKGSTYFQEFLDKLGDVAWDIHKLIKKIDEPGENGAGQFENPPEKTVYLAETTSDLDEKRDIILRELEQNHYTVLPDLPLPYKLKDGNFKDTVRDYLKRCKLSIHLIGHQYGLVPEGEKRSIIELQNEIASEQCENNQLKRLIWIPPGLDKNTLDEDQKNYITALQSDASQVRETELFETETGLEEFKTHIQDTLEKLKMAQEEEIKTYGQRPLIKRVYLVCDKQDVEDVKPIKKCLKSKRLEVMLPVFKGTSTQRLKIHKGHLSHCDAMMIYYDHANELWLESNLNELRGAPGYRKNESLIASAIYVTGEKSEHKDELDTLEAQIIRRYVPFSCDFLDRFVSQIHESKGGGA